MNLSKSLLFSQLCIVASSSKSLRGGRGSDHATRELKNTRIIGGNEAMEGRYSYAVSLQDDIGHFCGGSLIAPDIVLSASHCMQNKEGYKAVIGRHDLTDAVAGEIRTVKTEITHPEYNWGTTDNDFMILVLDQSVNQDIDLVKVGPNIIPVGSAVTVMGWGDTHPSEDILEHSDKLMETEAFVVSNEDCEKSNGTVGGTEIDGAIVGGWKDNYHDQITENMMCAQDTNEDSCQGDSGGPLVLRSETGDDVQVGVVSWGVSCAHEDFPGVYARVSAQYDWIKRHVCENSSAPPASFGCAPNGWRTIVAEHFSAGLGLFDHHENNVNRYPSAKHRAGVVRIANREALTSNQISLQHSTFSKIKVAFSFYAIEMEDSDDLCLGYELDDGAITGEKCWSSLHAFDNDKWYDEQAFEFEASDASTLRLRFVIKGDDNEDEVLIDSVTVQGQS